MPLRRTLLLAFAVLYTSVPAGAQTLGTFRWQLLPYCHVLSLKVVQDGAAYRLEGVDNLCGGGRVAPAIGLAVPNPDGSIAIGVTIIETTAGLPVHVSAVITLPSVDGTWRDSSGNGGAFRFTPGTPLPGEYRPVATRTATEIDWRQPPGGPERGISARASQETDDVGGNGAGIYGQWGNAGGSVSPGNAGVRGDSQTAIGVAGVTTSGMGVYGIAGGAGIGVVGSSIDGAGAAFFSTNGTGVVAGSGSGGTALTIENGALSVAGAVRPAFRHVAASGNTAGHYTSIDHPLLNGDATAMVYVQPVYEGGTSPFYFPDGVGVWYAAGQWNIFRNDTGVNMPLGAMFNVFVVKQ